MGGLVADKDKMAARRSTRRSKILSRAKQLNLVIISIK